MKGARLILIRYPSFPQKSEVLQATRNLIQTEQDYLLCYNNRCMQAVETIFERYQKSGKYDSSTKRQVIVKQKSLQTELVKKTARYSIANTSWTALLQKCFSMCHSSEIQMLTHMDAAVSYWFRHTKDDPILSSSSLNSSTQLLTITLPFSH